MRVTWTTQSTNSCFDLRTARAVGAPSAQSPQPPGSSGPAAHLDRVFNEDHRLLEAQVPPGLGAWSGEEQAGRGGVLARPRGTAGVRGRAWLLLPPGSGSRCLHLARPTPAQKGAPLGALPSRDTGRDTDRDTDRDTGFSPGARRSGSCPVTKPLGKKWSLGLERWTETASEITDKRQARDSGAVDGARARASHYRPSAWGTPEPSDPRPTRSPVLLDRPAFGCRFVKFWVWPP